MATSFASVKLSAPLVAWLKMEAARRGVRMYELAESLVENSLGGAPWLNAEFRSESGQFFGVRGHFHVKKRKRHRYNR